MVVGQVRKTCWDSIQICLEDGICGGWEEIAVLLVWWLLKSGAPLVCGWQMSPIVFKQRDLFTIIRAFKNIHGASASAAFLGLFQNCKRCPLFLSKSWCKATHSVIFFLWIVPKGIFLVMHQKPLFRFPLILTELFKASFAKRNPGWLMGHTQVCAWIRAVNTEYATVLANIFPT